MKKPKVAISACLLGEPVRYDGKDKAHLLIQQYLLPHIDVLPICPEVGAGMGVPREKIQLVKIDEQIRVRNVLKIDLDVTEKITEYARSILSEHGDIRAFILKAKSPSCGFNSTPVFQDGEIIQYASGQFSYMIKRTASNCHMLEETDLDCPQSCREFLSTLSEK